MEIQHIKLCVIKMVQLVQTERQSQKNEIVYHTAIRNMLRKRISVAMSYYQCKKARVCSIWNHEWPVDR